MMLRLTIDDPKAFHKPWTIAVPLSLLPDTSSSRAFVTVSRKRWSGG